MLVYGWTQPEDKGVGGDTETMKIIFEFVGGPMDGKALVGNDTDPPPQDGSRDWASAYYTLTDGGAVGKPFWTASDYSLGLLRTLSEKKLDRLNLQAHQYEVTDRLEGDDEVLVRVQYVEIVTNEGCA